MSLTVNTICAFHSVSYRLTHPGKQGPKEIISYEEALEKVKSEVGDNISLSDACTLCHLGFFVTHKSFDANESMHSFDGNLYYEDGACLTTSGAMIHPSSWMDDGWIIKADPLHIDFKKLIRMHGLSMGSMLVSDSYDQCIIRQ